MEPNSFRETVEIVKGAKAVNENLKIMIPRGRRLPGWKVKKNRRRNSPRKSTANTRMTTLHQWWLDSLDLTQKMGSKWTIFNMQNEPDLLAKWTRADLSRTETAEMAAIIRHLRRSGTSSTLKWDRKCPRCSHPKLTSFQFIKVYSQIK